MLARVDPKLLQMMPKLQILLDQILGFKFPACRHLGFHDVTALSYCFKQKNLSFPTIETTQWRHENQDGCAQEI